MATAQTTAKATGVGEDRILIPGVTWKQYLELLDWMGDRNIRITFDGDCVELMSPSYLHSRGDTLIGRMIEMVCFELDLDICSAAPVTLKTELMERGLEPDRSYWLANEPLVRGKTELDENVDPPPDLVIEVEVTRGILNRIAIYAALGVPEIWRWHKGKIEVLLLGDDGRYHPSGTSRSLPMLPMAEMSRWVERGLAMGERQWIREFVAWVRETIAPGQPPD
jgi:Uma2 family endonuclease